MSTFSPPPHPQPHNTWRICVNDLVLSRWNRAMPTPWPQYEVSATINTSNTSLSWNKHLRLTNCLNIQSKQLCYQIWIDFLSLRYLNTENPLQVWRTQLFRLSMFPSEALQTSSHPSVLFSSISYKWNKSTFGFFRFLEL